MTTRSGSTKWRMLGLSYLALIATFIPYIGWTPKIPEIIDELSISYTEAGLLGSVTALVGGLVLPFGGLLVDRWGAKNIILLGLVAVIIGQFGFAYAPEYSWMIVARALTGLGVGLLFVGPYTMAVHWFEQSGKNGVALGTMFTSDGVGTVISLYLFALVLTAWGWRNGSAIGGIALIAVFVIVALFLKNEPGHSPQRTTEHKPALSLKESLRPIADRNVLVAAAFFIGEWGLYALVASWMPTVLIEDAGWEPALAGLLSSLYVLAGVVTSIYFGLLSDKLGERKKIVVLAGFSMTVFVAALTIAMAAGNYTLVAICLPLIGLGVYTGMPVSLALATESAGSQHAGVVNGFILGIGFIFGGFVYPYILGYIKDTTGEFVVGFIGVTVATFLLCFIVALFGRDRKHTEPTSAQEAANT